MSFESIQIHTTQLFDLDTLNKLIECPEVDTDQKKRLKSLKSARTKYKAHGEVPATYTLSKKSKVSQTLGLGRIYGTITDLGSFQSSIRASLCEKFYYDIDIVNAQPTLLHQWAKKNVPDLDLPYLYHYVVNRQNVLNEISPNYTEAKEEVLKVIFGGRPLTSSSFLSSLAHEIKNIAHNAAIYSSDKTVRELWKIIKDQKDGSKIGSFLAYIVQTEERNVMLTMKQAMEDRKWAVDILIFDGFMVRKRKDTDLTQELLDEISEEVESKLGYTVKIIEKPLHPFEIPDKPSSTPTDLSGSIYQEMKEDFEKEHFYYAPSDSFVEVMKDGSLMHMDIRHAKRYLDMKWWWSEKTVDDKGHGHTQVKSFFDQWLLDKDRTAIKKIDMKPSLDPEVFSTPLRWAYKNDSEVDDELRKKLEKLFQDFLDILIQELLIKSTLLQWLAHLIQHPFTNPLMAVILSGPKGCGKDTLGDFICEWVVGTNLSQNYTSSEQYWEPHDTGRMNKLFIKLEEAQGVMNIAHAAEMKSRITGKDLTFNQKYVSAVTTANYNRTIMSTNEANPIDMTDGERRTMIVQCSPALIGKMDYWKEFRKLFFNPIGGKVIGEWLENYTSIGEWPRMPPLSKLALDMIEDQTTSELRFIRDCKDWDGSEVTATSLYHFYRSFCISNELPYCKTMKSLGERLAVYVRDGLIKKKKMSSTFYYK